MNWCGEIRAPTLTANGLNEWCLLSELLTCVRDEDMERGDLHVLLADVDVVRSEGSFLASSCAPPLPASISIVPLSFPFTCTI